MGNELVVRKSSLPASQRIHRAAQYVRMSTERQQYSIQNQAAAIAAYAHSNKLTIVRTYRDEGESGLLIKNRAGLIQLLEDVQAGETDFAHILVYDVSRWGRFQDADESAHYEFICKRAGVRVAYCAEQFDNDGSMLASIVKNIKRVMAAEYSRELSSKVYAGQCRFARLGYKPCGKVGYGLVRELVDEKADIVVALFVPRIRDWVAKIAHDETRHNDQQHEQNLRQAIEILVRWGNDDDRRFIEEVAQQRLAGGLTVPFAKVWLPPLLNLNPVAAIDVLEKGLANMPAAKLGSGVQLFADLFGHDFGGFGFDLHGPGFTPPLLLRLLRLAYIQVRIGDDTEHEGSHSLDTRDYAERGRGAILGALFASTGPEGWAAKIEVAGDCLFAHIKDRTLALAEKKAAEEADGVALTETEFCILDKTGESPPKTCEAMFALMRDRLDDIDDLLLQDISPRALWASITDEHIMRRELARALRDAANHSYTVDQEAVTADEKETDIRFRSTGSAQQGTIELKLGDDRSGRDLFDTIRDQLLTKYMAADDCRAGCLLVTIAKERKWDHPKTGKQLDFAELMTVLSDEAERISTELGGTAKLMAKGLDLRPRLSSERSSRAKRRQG
ncbi:recombinase family protein [Bradyrhizobium sp. USDA 223]|uniref:recombinase family protein n=1 Tax=Bradyrhizobium sp. USDA 223 TaxID=3156306 RepID=UPI00383689D8